jgi:hypothetical protein
MPDFYKALKRKTRNRQYIIKSKKRKPNKIKSRSRSRSKSKTKGKTALEKMMIKQNKEEKGDWKKNLDALTRMRDHPYERGNIQQPLEIPSGPPWKHFSQSALYSAPKEKDITIRPPSQWSSPKDLNFEDELTSQDYKELSDKAVEAYLNSIAKGTKKKRKKGKKKKGKKKKGTKKKKKGGG